MGKNVYTEIKCHSLLPLDDIVSMVCHPDCISEVGTLMIISMVATWWLYQRQVVYQGGVSTLIIIDVATWYNGSALLFSKDVFCLTIIFKISLSLFSIYNTLFNQIRTSHCRASNTRLFLMAPVLVVAHICPITVLLNLARGDPDNPDIQILSRKFSDPDGIRTRVTGERTTHLTTKMCFTISIQWLAF